MPLFSAVLLQQQIKLDSRIPMPRPTSFAPQALLSLLAVAQPGCLPPRKAQISGARPSQIRRLRVNCSLDPWQALKMCAWVEARRPSQLLISIPQPLKIKRCSQLQSRNIAQLATWDSHRARLWRFWHKPQQILFRKTCRAKKQSVPL